MNLHLRNLFLFFGILLSCTCFAQNKKQLPPIWNKTTGVQYESQTRAYITPTRIVLQENNDGEIINIDNLLEEGNGQALLSNSKISILKSGQGTPPRFVLDFGYQLYGGLQIVTGRPRSKEPVRIRITFGESVSEAMTNMDDNKGLTNDHAMHCFDIEVPWLGSLDIGNTGFRFAAIELIEPDSELHLKEVRASFVYRDIPYFGSFKSNDERLNQVWMTGAYTVHLNMQDYLWDGIKRDQLVWIGDLHPEIMTISSVFGYNEIVPKSLDLIRDITPLPGWMNNISSYSIWWVLIHRDWYHFHGDKKYLMEQKEYLVGLLNLLMSKIDENGQEKLGALRFLDWPSSEDPEAINAGLQSLMTQAMKSGSELCRILGDNQTADKCEQAYKRLMKVKLPHNNSKQAASLMALSGIMSAKKAHKDVLSVGGSKNFSTFYGYYMLEAIALAGEYTFALDRIRDYWGGMLDMGATTFWEDFNMDWLENAAPIDEIVPEGKVDIHAAYGDYCYKNLRHSLAHGWASGPTAFLSRHVLGVEVIEPGCKKVRIKPNLGDLEWVEGTFPTPYGLIKIRHDKDKNGKVISKIDAPKEVEIIK